MSINKTVKSFKDSFGEKVKTDSAFTSFYASYDRKVGMPSAVIFPKSVDDLCQVLQLANDSCMPIVVRGSGCENVPNNSVVVDLKGMGRLLKTDGAHGGLWAETGIFLPQINTYLHKYAFQLKSFHWDFSRTLGGVIATDGVDGNSFKYGTAQRQICGIEVVTPTGELIQCSEDKNDELFYLNLNGYGQFGVITKALVKIVPAVKSFFSFVSYEGVGDLAITDMLELADIGLPDYMIMFVTGDHYTMVLGFDEREKLRYFQNEIQAKKKLYKTKKSWSFFKSKKSYETQEIAEIRSNLLAQLEQARDTGDAQSRERFLFGIYKSMKQTGAVRVSSVAVPLPKIFEMAHRIQEISHKKFPNCYFSILLTKTAPGGYTRGGYSLSDNRKDDLIAVLNVFFIERGEDDKIHVWQNKLFSIAEKLGGRRFGDSAQINCLVNSANYEVLKAKKVSVDPNNILNSHVPFSEA